jgi:thiazole/oxazole-forming peptide maturase SagD family component
LALVGYVRQPKEPQFMLGVSTGTAAHTQYDQALRRALLELIQIDSAMGHWYGRQEAVLIEHDGRTQVVYDLIKSRIPTYGPRPRFYLLQNADLPGLAVACVLEDQDVPKVVVGLGCDLRLTRSIYKAFLEAVAVAQLAKVILFRQSVGELPKDIGPSELYDLDLNVAYYSVLGPEAIRDKFGDRPVRPASELPADIDLGVKGDLRHMVDSFAATGKELVFLDLTTSDIKALGFCVTRVWSPDTISLSFPSAPPLMHQRFQAYGGVASEAPHPYP